MTLSKSRRRRTLRGVLFVGVLLIAEASFAAPSGRLQVHDPRLALKLFASDPEIVTPIGLAIDERDRIFVIESHTHMPPKGYPGPKSDRIKMFEDKDRDAKPDRMEVVAEGFNSAMNLAFSPQGRLYVVCARDVWALEGASRRRILELRTSNTYSHSALLGITFGTDGWLYVSRGNNASAAYTLTGTDGTNVSGYGDGGNIVRCRPNGSKLEEFATGFWNPFDIKFDTAGRLLCVDNDPDARGPNRLLHVVRHGDYGYRSLYGGGGNHPFQAWAGELPGTLPMIDGTGEAPSGLIDCARGALPKDYAGSVLATIWNENTITCHKTAPRGISLSATNRVLISGGQDFRPVAIAADSAGAFYITDWVLVDYPNHGRGRIWKLSAKPGHAVTQPVAQFAAPRLTPELQEFESLLVSGDTRNYAQLEMALRSDDAFLQHAAVVALARPVFRVQVRAATRHVDAAVRLGALLALRRAGIENPQPFLRAWLKDPSPEVRRMALVWIGEGMFAELRDSLEDAVGGENISATLFETWLAAVECLDATYVGAFRSRAKDKANQLQRKLPPGLLEAVIVNTNHSPHVRALALTRLNDNGTESRFGLVARLAVKSEPRVQKEALRTLAAMHRPQVPQILAGVALDHSQTPNARAEALLALGGQTLADVSALLTLLRDSDPVLQTECVRLLRARPDDSRVRQALERALEAMRNSSGRSAVVEQLEHALFPPGAKRPSDCRPRPASEPEWHSALATGGDPVAGERVFFARTTGCTQCHTVHNRGRKLGPDLSNVGQSLKRALIVQSILRPSEKFAPQYQAWFVETRDGGMHQGLQLDHKAGGAVELLVSGDSVQHFAGRDVAAYGPARKSLMPDGLEEGITVSEFRDLVAFLESLK